MSVSFNKIKYAWDNFDIKNDKVISKTNKQQLDDEQDTREIAYLLAIYNACNSVEGWEDNSTSLVYNAYCQSMIADYEEIINKSISQDKLFINHNYLVSFYNKWLLPPLSKNNKFADLAYLQSTEFIVRKSVFSALFNLNCIKAFAEYLNPNILLDIKSKENKKNIKNLSKLNKKDFCLNDISFTLTPAETMASIGSHPTF